MLLSRYGDALNNLRSAFKSSGKYGYDLHFQLVNAADYGVPEDRERVLFIGIRKDLNLRYEFPKPTTPKDRRITLKDAIGDIQDALPRPLPNGVVNISSNHSGLQNNEYLVGGFSPIYMSRNRVRAWDELSFTIQASGRQAPIHPGAPKMIHVGKDKYEFVPDKKDSYRRLSVREIARIQTFPDNFVFKYDNINNGYKMIGNAVPVNLAYIVAKSLMKIFSNE